MMQAATWTAGGALFIVAAIGWSYVKPVEPVAVDVKIVEKAAYPDRVEVMLEWQNQRDCEFWSLTTVIGSDGNQDELRVPVQRDLGPPKGPRGLGRQATIDPWIFYAPPDFSAVGPDFIMTAWHRCGAESVPSRMLVMPAREFFGRTGDGLSVMKREGGT